MRYILVFFLIYVYSNQFFPKVKQNNTIKKYEQRAEKSDKKAQYKLAKFYQKGKFVSRDLSKYRYWLELSAKQNYKWAEFELANIYKEEKKYKKSFELMKASADQGHIWASYNLALMYFDGIGTSKDYQKSFRYMQAPVLFGYKKAQYAMAKMYYYGYGIEQDTDMAIELLKMAIEQKESKSMMMLAKIYQKDNKIKKVIKLYDEASKLGNNDAKYQLGKIYEKAQIYNKAEQLYIASSNNGNQKARQRLINLYLNRFDNPHKAINLYINNDFLKSDFYIPNHLSKPIIWSELIF
jgi:TPR repeat protein